jgi:hypothetical protein
MSHTIKVIAAGFALLVVCLLGGHLMGDGHQSASIARAALVFVALWFVGAALNMWIGVSKAGYSVAEEANLPRCVPGPRRGCASGVVEILARLSRVRLPQRAGVIQHPSYS